MRFRFRDTHGRVISLPDVASLLQAIRSGAVGPETQLAIGKQRAWQRADSVAAYREAIVALGQLPNEGMVPPAADFAKPSESWRLLSRSPRALVALALGVVVLLGVGFRASFGGHRSEGLAPAPAPKVVSGLRAGSQLQVYSLQFGDSVALELRRLQDWLSSHRVAARLRGAALKHPASLRALRVTGAGYRLRIDSVASRNGELARRLVARAEALEGAERGFEGLATALEDDLAVWSREFAAHLEILRGVAAVLDSLPAFLLGKQNSFTVWEGSAAFLSHDDGARFAALEARFSELAVQEHSWSTRLFAHRPDWMGGVMEDERPRFGVPLRDSR